ncbi:MAG: cupin domain-containing protein [Ignavibacteriales bacterium]|nr:cupin domain-containing protein [Ignavibacteriales bacterium]
MSTTDLNGIASELINYSEKSIVSRQLLKNPSGNVTLFAFDKDENLTEHSSPYDALVNVVEGKMEIKIGGEPYVVGTSTIIKLPANIPHGLVALEKTKMILIMIKG